MDRAQTTGLKPSMRCEAELMLDRVEEVLTVPIQAVFSDADVRYAYIRSGSKFSRRPLQLGRQSDTTAEVLKGLDANMEVLTREPAPAEVWPGAWEKSDLELAGYQLGPDGQPIATRERGPRGGKGKPEGSQEPLGKEAVVTTEKPAEGNADQAPKPEGDKPTTESKGTPAEPAPKPTGRD